MRILIADSQSRVRFALRLLLGRRPGEEVVGEVAHAKDLLPQIEATNPNVVLLDWELPGLEADSWLSALRQTHPDLFVIALSGRPGARQATLSAGANAFVSKTDPPEQLLSTLNNCRHSYLSRL